MRKMMTTLLIPPLTLNERMGRLSAAGAIMPALGALYIGALLRKEGFDVNILDSEGLGLGLKATVDEILKRKTGILGITTTTLSILPAIAVAKEVKARDLARLRQRGEPEIKIFLGGPHVTAVPEETMEMFPEIDGCVLGDGELSFLEVVRNISNATGCGEGVDGLIWRENGKILSNKKTRHVKDLDKLPFPGWDMLEGFPKIYRPPFHSYRRLPVANIITARGCSRNCSFCDRSVFGNRINSHSIEYVIDMIERLIKDYSIREISIKDDIFMTSEERVSEFCRRIRAKRLGIPWSCNARVDSVSEKMLGEMKKAGCWMISYGIESGSDKMLEKMNKLITRETVVKALNITRKAGIMSKGFFMLGIPGETEETLEETLEFVQELKLDELNVNFFTPFPGSALFNELVKDGFKPDYSRMNMLEPVYIPKGISEKMLYEYQKKIIYSFYLRLSKIAVFGLRAMKNPDGWKSLMRMAGLFAGMAGKKEY